MQVRFVPKIPRQYGMEAPLMWLFAPFLIAASTIPQWLFAAAPAPVCENLVLVGANARALGFTDSEKRLLCGDPKTPDWQRVPRSQAVFALKNFLQERGFYYPTITDKDGVAEVDIGQPTNVTAVSFTGEPDALHGWKGRIFLKERLTPKLLQAVSDEVAVRLGDYGYACPKVETKADPSTGTLHIHIAPGKPQNLTSINEQKVEGVAPGALRRYDAFLLGKLYRAPLLPLTASRVITDGIVQNTFFDVRRTPEGVVADQKTLAGKPRQVTLGFGFNTDRGLSARGTWKHSRLGPWGSQIFTSVTASWKGAEFNTEEGRIESIWYVFNRPSRFSLRPTLSVRHQSDNRLQIFGVVAQLSPTITWDLEHFGGFASIGPVLTGERKLRGEGRDQAVYLSLTAEARLTSHDFEWQRTEPRSGFELSAAASFSRRNVLAEFTSQLLRLRYTHLWNLPEESRTRLVLGIRAGISGTWVPSDEGGFATLAPSLRHYLGGSSNLRGFGFQELPDAQGGLTSFFGSAEARGTGLLPLDLQPYLFADIGSVSRNTFDFSAPWYLSPGFGLRYPSAFGVFRASLAHGMPLSNAGIAGHWQFQFSYGEEF